MRQYGAFEAKTHFSELLEKVSQGEKCIITKHGTKLAVLVPFTTVDIPDSSTEAIRAIKVLRKGLTLGKKTSIKKLRAEGRQ